MSSEENLLEPTFVFGLTTAPTNSCVFGTEDQIVYRASGVIVVHDVIEKTQKFLYMNDPLKVISTMDISNSRKLLAVAVRGKRPCIDIYNLTNLKHVRQLIVQTEMKARSFIRVKFSHNDVFLAVLSDSPDYKMYYFDWKQLKVESRMQVILPPSVFGLVHEMALNPVKNHSCCFVGTGLFRLMHMKELAWKQYGFHKAKKFNFTAACWLDGDSVLAGTADGQVFIFVEGELRATYNVETLTDFDTSLMNINSTRGGHLEIRHCQSLKNGLMFVVDGNSIHHYKLIIDKQYKRVAVFYIPDSDGRHPDGSRVKAINTLSVGPKNRRLVCVTENAQLYLAYTISTPESSDVFIEPFGATLHTGGVCSLSISDWMPVFISCGKSDHTVKLWDYHECRLLLSKRYEENVVDVSLHPSGLYALVAFNGGIAFTAVSCVDGLVVRKTFEGINCCVTRFSDSGHMFAVADGTVVDVYCSIWHKKLFTLYGHKHSITDLVWAANDWKIYTCDERGGLCRFNLYTGHNIIDIEIPNQIFWAMAVSNDLKSIYTASQDCRIREIYGRTVIRTQNLQHGVINGMALSKTNDMLLVACQFGAILSLPLPLKSKPEYDEFNVHNKTVSMMKLSTDNNSLISCSVDDSICIWKVKNANILHVKLAFEVNTLSSTNYLRRKMDKIEEVKLKLEKLTKLRDRDIVKLTKAYEPRLKSAHDHYAMNMKRIEYEKKASDKLFRADEARLKNEMSTSKKKHEIDWITSKNNYENQLLYEDKKYEQLKEDLSNCEEDFKKKEKIITEEHQQVIHKLTEVFHRDLKAEEDTFEKIKNEILKDMEEIYLKIDEFNDQADREMLELKIHYDHKFKKLPPATRKSLAVVNAYKEKLRLNQNKGADFQFLFEKFQDDIEKLIVTKERLTASITETEMELMKQKRLQYEVNDVIECKKLDCEDMKKQLMLLKRNAVEHENIIDPLKSTLDETKITLADVTKELKLTHLILERVKKEVALKESKIALILSETAKAMEHHQSQNAVIMNVTIDIQFSFKNNENGKQLKKLHDQFVKKEMSASLKTDLFRQIRFKEKLLLYLKESKIAADQKAPSYLKLTKDNRMLVELVNELSKELATNKLMLHELEHAVTEKMHKKKNENAAEH